MINEASSMTAGWPAAPQGWALLLCVFLFGLSVPLATAYAEDNVIKIKPTSSLVNLVKYEADKKLKVRGWKLSPTLYFGHTKVNNRFGLGFMYGKPSYTVGVNHHGLAFLKRF